MAIKDSLKETVTNDDFYKGLALGVAVGAIGYHLYQNYGELMKNKVTGFFTFDKSVVLKVKIPANLQDAFKAHKKEVEKDTAA